MERCGENDMITRKSSQWNLACASAFRLERTFSSDRSGLSRWQPSESRCRPGQEQMKPTKLRADGRRPWADPGCSACLGNPTRVIFADRFPTRDTQRRRAVRGPQPHQRQLDPRRLRQGIRTGCIGCCRGRAGGLRVAKGEVLGLLTRSRRVKTLANCPDSVTPIPYLRRWRACLCLLARGAQASDGRQGRQAAVPPGTPPMAGVWGRGWWGETDRPWP